MPNAAPPRHWLMKSEPSVFSFDDLWKAPKRTTHWAGVRNYQARNFMREMRRGDLVLFYHSGVEPAGIAGTAEVVRTAYPDASALDARDHGYDPKSTAENPIWEMVDVRAKERFSHFVTRDDLKAEPGLQAMRVMQRGQRLSVMPVEPAEWELVCRLGAGDATR